jgi:hypothetical protein
VKSLFALFLAVGLVCVAADRCDAQTAGNSSIVESPQSVSPSAIAGTPHLLKFKGHLSSGPGVVGVMFALYSEQQAGPALWQEAQNVTVDVNGDYSVLLGANTIDGLPTALFDADGPHWLGVQVSGQQELPRLLLVSVPYALKAKDADTLGGKPASAYALANSSGAVTAVAGNSPTGSTQSLTTLTGTSNFLGKFLDASTLIDSMIYESNGLVGINNNSPSVALDVTGDVKAINGNFLGRVILGSTMLAAADVATSSQGFSSGGLDLDTSVFNSATGQAQDQLFRWQALPVSNNTATPTGRLAFLSGTSPANAAETGLSISNTGVINFAAGQTFPGAAQVTAPNTFVAPIVVGQTGPQTVPLTVQGSVGQTSDVFSVQNSSGQSLFKITPNGQLQGGTPGGSFSLVPSSSSNGNLLFSPAGPGNSVFAFPNASGQSSALFVARAGFGQTGSILEGQNYSGQPLFTLSPGGDSTLRNWNDSTVGLNFSAGNSSAQNKELRGFDRSTLQYTMRFTADGHVDFLSGPTQARRFRVAGDSDKVMFGAALDTNLYRAGPNALATDGGLLVNYAGGPTYPFEIRNGGQSVFRILANGAFEGGASGGSLMFRPSAQSNGNFVLSPGTSSNSVFVLPQVAGQSAASFVSRAGVSQTGSLIEAQNNLSQPLLAVSTTGNTQWNNWSDQTFALNLVAGNASSQAKEIRGFDRATLQYTMRFTPDGHIDFLSGPAQTRRFRLAGDSDKLLFGSALDANLYRNGPAALATDGSMLINNNAGAAYPLDVRNGSGQSIFRIGADGSLEGGGTGSLLFRPAAASNGNVVLSPGNGTGSVYVSPIAANQSAANFVSQATSGQTGSLIEARNFMAQPLMSVSPTGDTQWNNWSDQTFALNLVAGNASSQAKEIRGFDRATLQYTMRFTPDGNVDFLSGPSQQRRMRISGTSDALLFGANGDTNLYRSAAGVLNTDGAMVIAPLGLDFSPVVGAKLYVQGNYGAEAVIVDVPAGTPTDLQTWRVGGNVVADITSTGAMELNAISFQNSLGGGNGEVSEAAGGSLSLRAGSLGNGNILFDSQAGGQQAFSYGGILQQYFSPAGLTLMSPAAIRFQPAGGAPTTVLQGNGDNSLSIGSLGGGIRFNSVTAAPLASISETGNLQVSGDAGFAGGVSATSATIAGAVTATSFAGDGSALQNITATNSATLGGLVPAAFEQTVNKNQPAGYAGLDGSGKMARAQTPAASVFTDQSNIYSAGVQDFTAASSTLPVKSVLSVNTPATCAANKEMLIKTDAPAGQQLFICNATGDGFNALGSSAAQLTVTQGVTPDGGGLKHLRASVPSVSAAGALDVAITWATPFADAQYTATCSVVDSAAANGALRVHHLISVTATGVTVRLVNDDVANAHAGSVHCIAMHD